MLHHLSGFGNDEILEVLAAVLVEFLLGHSSVTVGVCVIEALEALYVIFNEEIAKFFILSAEQYPLFLVQAIVLVLVTGSEQFCDCVFDNVDNWIQATRHHVNRRFGELQEEALELVARDHSVLVLIKLSHDLLGLLTVLISDWLALRNQSCGLIKFDLSVAIGIERLH